MQLTLQRFPDRLRYFRLKLRLYFRAFWKIRRGGPVICQGLSKPLASSADVAYRAGRVFRVLLWILAS